MNHQRLFFRATGLALVLAASALAPAWAAGDYSANGTLIAQATTAESANTPQKTQRPVPFGGGSAGGTGCTSG